MIAAHLVQKDRIPAPRLLAALALSGFAAGMFAEWCFVNTVPSGTPVFGGLCEQLYYTGCAALAVPALVAWEQRKSWRVPRFWMVFGGASYLLYLIHEPLSSVVAKVLSAPLIKPMLTAPVAFAINIAVVVVAAMILHLIIEKPVLSWLRAALRIDSARGIATGSLGTAVSSRI
jgi:exopolysaccharide production protein ExoZ